MNNNAFRWNTKWTMNMLLQGEIRMELLSTGAELSLSVPWLFPSESLLDEVLPVCGWRVRTASSICVWHNRFLDRVCGYWIIHDPKPKENRCRIDRRQTDILCCGVIIILATYVFPDGLPTDLVGRRNAIKQRTPHPSLPPNHPPNCAVSGGREADPNIPPYKLKFS